MSRKLALLNTALLQIQARQQDKVACGVEQRGEWSRAGCGAEQGVDFSDPDQWFLLGYFEKLKKSVEMEK